MVFFDLRKGLFREIFICSILYMYLLFNKFIYNNDLIKGMCMYYCKLRDMFYVRLYIVYYSFKM